MSNPTDVLAELGNLNEQAIGLSQRGDDFSSLISGSGNWISGDNRPVTINILVPKDADFHGSKLNILLGARVIDQENLGTSSSELAFRPASWVTVNNTPTSLPSKPVQDANATFTMEDTFNGAFQGSDPLPIACVFSSRYGQYIIQDEFITSAWPGGMHFVVPYKLKRGSTVTIAVSPTFSRAQDSTMLKTQFRATAVITGKKILTRAQ